MNFKSGSPHSAYPLRAVLRVAAVAALGLPFEPSTQAPHMLASVRPPPRAQHADVIPPSDPFVVIYNHYDRPGLRAWWGSVLVLKTVGERRIREPRAAPALTEQRRDSSSRGW